MVLVFGAGCVPELQSAMPPCPAKPDTVAYRDAPSGLVSAQVANSIDRFEALPGDVAVDFLCDPDWGGASSGRLAIHPAAAEDLRIVSSGRADCDLGNVLWAGDVVVTASSLAGLGGRTGQIGGSSPSFLTITFDPSYDPRLSSVTLFIFLNDTGPLGKFEFALQPMTNPNGTKTMAGHECVVRVSGTGAP